MISMLSLTAAGSKMKPIVKLIHPAANAKTVLLEYYGEVNSADVKYNVGAQLMLDTTIGFRYDVSFLQGSKAMSHVALFYKFSSPYQTIFYNYLNHKSEVIKQTASTGSNDISVIGKEKIDSFACTHLRHAVNHDSEDYWMSTAVPGFSQLTQVLQHIDAGLMSSINGTIFNWGGLVKLSMISSSSKGQIEFKLHLIDAKTGLRFETSNFEVPKH
ncbi:MAG: hypothetical protein ACJ749_05075 [Flavisolibacter sp.]